MYLVNEMNLSPADSYAKSKARSKFPKTNRFAEGFPFELDLFQIEACHALEDGKGVLEIGRAHV